MTCSSCLRAMQIANHGAYVDGCIGCGVRRLAHMTPEERERTLDRIQAVHGWTARVEAIKLLRVERARLKKLRGHRSHERA